MNKYELARDPNTSPGVLEELAGDEDYWIRSRVAQNLNYPIKLLEKLADDEYREVRSWVTLNPNCPEYIKTFIEARNYTEKHYEQV